MGLESKSFLKTVEPYQIDETIENFILDETMQRRLYDDLTEKTIILSLSTKCKACFEVMEKLDQYVGQAKDTAWIILIECEDEDVPIIRQAIPSQIRLYPFTREGSMQYMRVLGIPWITMLHNRQVVVHHPYYEEGMLGWMEQLHVRAVAGVV